MTVATAVPQKDVIELLNKGMRLEKGIALERSKHAMVRLTSYHGLYVPDTATTMIRDMLHTRLQLEKGSECKHLVLYVLSCWVFELTRIRR